MISVSLTAKLAVAVVASSFGHNFAIVQAGQTLSAIAAANETSWQQLAAVNHLADPNLIKAGQVIYLVSSGDGDDLGGQGEAPQAPGYQPSNPAPVSPPASGTAPSEGSFEQCVIQRESGGDAQVMNSTGHYGLYQFSYSTWVGAGGNPSDFGHASVSEQEGVFSSAYAKWGVSPWAAYDHC